MKLPKQWHRHCSCDDLGAGDGTTGNKHPEIENERCAKVYL